MHRKIHALITGEPSLRNADGTYVSASWVKARKKIVYYVCESIAGFVLYDRLPDGIFIQMLYVRPMSRNSGIGSYLIKALLSSEKKKLFVGYANPNSQQLLKKLGFAIGTIPYREVFYRRNFDKQKKLSR